MSTATKRTIDALSSLTDDECLDVLVHAIKHRKGVAGEALRLHQPFVNAVACQLRDEKCFDGPLQAKPGTEMLRTELGNNTQESFFYYPKDKKGILVVNTKAKVYAFWVDAETQVLTVLAPMNKDLAQTTPSCKLFHALQRGCPLRLFESRADNKVEAVGDVTSDTSTGPFWDVFHPTDDELKTLYPGKAAHLLAKASGCAQFKFRLKMAIADEAKSELRRLMDLQGVPTVETTVTYPNGAGQYKGQWDEAVGRPHGRGTMVDANGLTYEGDWVKGKYHGHGTLTNATKTDTYTGQWRDDMKHGRGEERIDDEYYVGPFEFNERHGTGAVCLVDNGEFVYEGEWKAGERDGQGTSYLNFLGVNTKRYEGEWKAGERDGQGTSYYPVDGKAVKAYEGSWQDGDRHGVGTAYDTEEGTSAKVYKGEWANGRRNGQGTEYGDALPDGTVPEVYTGGWKDDDYNGFGACFDVCEKVMYRGNFVDGMYDGHGVEFFKSGEIKYLGYFAAGKREGLGTEYEKSGCVRYKGRWTEGTYLLSEASDAESDGSDAESDGSDDAESEGSAAESEGSAESAESDAESEGSVESAESEESDAESEEDAPART